MKTMTATVEQSARWPHADTACSLCHRDLSPKGGRRDGEGYAAALAEHVERSHFVPEVGEFVAYTMVTDTAVYEIVDVSKTGKSMKIRTTLRGPVLRTDGASYPIVDTEAVSDPTGTVRVVRLRKDHTWRIADWARLYPAPRINGKPVSHTNYTM